MGALETTQRIDRFFFWSIHQVKDRKLPIVEQEI